MTAGILYRDGPGDAIHALDSAHGAHDQAHASGGRHVLRGDAGGVQFNPGLRQLCLGGGAQFAADGFGIGGLDHIALGELVEALDLGAGIQGDGVAQRPLQGDVAGLGVYGDDFRGDLLGDRTLAVALHGDFHFGDGGGGQCAQRQAGY